MSQTATDLQARIDADLKQAMRDRDDVTKLTLRAVKTALTEATKAEDASALDDQAVMAVIQREAKRRRDAAAEFEQLGDQARAEQERAELAVLEVYLPKQLSEADIEAIARDVIADLGATSMKEMGQVMSAIMPKVQGVADGKAVNQVVRRLLSGASDK